jgi:hypothetical protein
VNILETDTLTSHVPKRSRSKELPHPSQPSSTQTHSVSSKLSKEPGTRPISQEQLVAEVKGIYAGLFMAESQCIEVGNAQNSQSDAGKLNNEQWQALVVLQPTLLHEHHDFFLASQHPSASPALHRLACKYAMPVRMWRHGIHSYLELLRHRLPASLEHLLTFIYLAYSMMALLYETVPTFEDTWIECLGDLGRYRLVNAGYSSPPPWRVNVLRWVKGWRLRMMISETVRCGPRFPSIGFPKHPKRRLQPAASIITSIYSQDQMPCNSCSITPNPSALPSHLKQHASRPRHSLTTQF